MTIRNLKKIFQPNSIAVVGASDAPQKVGCQVLRNLRRGGFRGEIFPVNSKHDRVQGMTAFPTLSALPRKPDLAIICTPAQTVPALVEECGKLGIDGMIVLSAGFRETGEAGKQLEAEVKEAAARHPGLRLVGPNCLGVMVPAAGLNASFAATMAAPGRVAFVSQSGALCTAVLDWAKFEGIGFSHFISVGNMLDVGIDDLLDYLAADPTTDSVVLYVESIIRARDFLSAARAFSLTKPIVAYKAGRFADSAQAAASHTGALAGVDAVYEAAFKRAGIVRVNDLDEIFDCAELLSRFKLPKGPRLAIITNAGGPGVMACDALLERRGVIAKLAPATIEQLNARLPPFWSHRNPVDLLGDAPPSRYSEAIDIVLQDPQVDGALILLTPQAMTDATASAKAVGEIAKHAQKPILAAWMGGTSVAEGVRLLQAGGVPTYSTAEHGVRAFMRLVEFRSLREAILETPQELPIQVPLDRKALKAKLEALPTTRGDFLSESDSKELLSAYGINSVTPRIAANADDAVNAANELGFPVVLKLQSHAITHKTEVEGVLLNLMDESQVRSAFDRIIASAKRLRPEADIGGVTVQRMITAVGGVEMILGIKRDPVFGPVIMVGAGGIAAELSQDIAMELPPLNETLARRMIESLRIWPLLRGYRGRPAVAIERLLETILRLSYMAAQIPEICELDVNPLLVTPSEVIALDARVLLADPAPSATTRPYAHLAICPYPHEYTQTTQLADGTEVFIRAIRPEDEPAWKDLIRRSSTESIWKRFRYLFQDASHEMAARFCFVDYDRELALCAETIMEGKRLLIGVARLVADPDHEQADYAVLIADDYQRRGLGTKLTTISIEIGRRWGLQQIKSETTADNLAMLRVYNRHHFAVRSSSDSRIVLAELPLNDSAS